MLRFPSRAIAYALVALSVAVCDDPTGPSPVPEEVALPQFNVAGAPLPYPILAGAGDVANCALGNDNDESTARLLDVIFANGQPGNVMQLGEPDETATAANYPGCYVDTWGRHKAITRPMPGNKDYINGNIDHYFRYWGAAAGEAPGGYYSFDASEYWHVVVINSNNTFVPTNTDAAPQVAWLRNDLLLNTKPCIAAFMHHPRFFSSTTPNVDTEAGSLRPVWNELYKHGAEFVASGNRHHYERLKPMRADGTVDLALGVIQFISGTGGTSLGLPQDGVGSIHPNTDVRGVDYGVVKFTLKPDGYDWQFVPARNRFNDAGSANCHPPTIPVSLRMTSSSPSSVYSQPVTFTAKAEDGTNTVRVGTVSFISGGTCDAPVGVLASDIGLDETGRAKFTTLSLDVAGSPHSIIACYTGAGSYRSSTGEIAHTVERATASVTLADLVATYDGLAKSATATTAPADLPVSLAYATAAGDPVAAPIDAGQYTVTATVEDPNYSGGATDAFRIEKATPIITWAQPAPITYGTPLGPTQLSATASFNSQPVAGAFTYSPTAGTVLDAGANQILSADFTPAAAGNFNSVLGTTVLISVTGASQTIDFANPGNKTFGDPPFELLATATSGLVVSYAALGACSVAGTTVTIDAAGSCTLTASQGGDANYQPAESVVHSIVIARKVATVTLGSLVHNYDGQPKSASASTDASGESAFQFEYQRNGAAVAQPTDAGTYTVVATLINANYQGAATGTLVINAGPVAIADEYSVDEDGALSIAAPGVIGNDVDPDGGEIAPSLVSSTSSGALELNADGSFAYVPARDFTGTDAFSYRISDGSLTSDPVTVTITVNPVNDAPVATADSYTTAENVALDIAASGVLANDSDVDGSAMFAELVAAPAHGQLVLASSGSFTYTPDDGFNGGDSFTYRASDGSASSQIVTVAITVTSVNTAPSVVDDASYVVDEDQTLTTPVTASVLANDSDGDRDPLTAELVEGPLPGTTASFALNPDGTFSFQPAPDFFGTTTFTYRATDGTAVSGSATVTMTVNGINDAPGFAIGADQTVAEDAGPQTVVGWASAISAGAANESGQTLTFDITGNTNSGLFVTPPTVSPAGVLTYTPAANANGEATLTIVLRDNGGTAGGGSDASAPRTFRVTVSAVNDAPVATAQSVSTAEDTPVTITLTASDIEGDALTFEITAAPANGSLAPTGTPGAYTYTPNANFSGTDEFAFTASDGTPCAPSTVTISVGTVNDAPVAGDDQYTVDEDNVLAAAGIQGVLANDADTDGDALTASVVADRGPSHGTVAFNADGTFAYTPNPNFHGVDGFTYQVTDGRGGTAQATVAIAVNPINDAPAATEDGGYTVSEDQTLTTTASTGVLANDTDVDDAQLTALVVTPPASGNLTLNADGSFIYTPNTDFSGTDSFEYQAGDGELASSVVTVTIVVGAANDAPVAGDDALDAVEDTPHTISVLANDSDPEAGTLTPALVDGQGPTNGTVALNTDGTFTYTPNANFSGSDGFSYTVSDGSATSNVARVTITVAPVNDAPVAQPQAVTTNEETPVTITLAGQDIENSQLAYRITAQPSYGSLSGEGTVYTYTPGANYRGDDAFAFVVNDGTDDSAPAVVSITVSSVNDIPSPTADQYAVDEDNVLTVGAGQSILGNDTDGDGDALTASLVINRGPSSGTLDLNPDGTFTYAPNADFHGTDQFTYQASDGSGGHASTTVTITVNPVNDAPVADASAVTTAEDTPLVVSVSSSDPDGDALSFSIATPPSHGSLAPGATVGTYTYSPDANFTGSDSFTYRASDGALASVATITITVDPRNDNPVATSDASVGTEDSPQTIAVLANDTDPDGDNLSAQPVDGQGPANGTVLLNADGTFIYTPNANFVGTDGFSYRASDGAGSSNVATVSITVTAINDAPVAGAQTVSTDEDTPRTITLAAEDQDGDQLIYRITAQPSHGTLSGEGNVYVYTPATDYQGPDAFSFVANDGTADSEQATVAIAVAPKNDAPVAVDNSYGTAEEQQLTVAPTAGVLRNDTDSDADELSAVLVSGPANGTLTLSADGSFAYSPNANFSGSDSFTYRATDGGLPSNVATVTITVAARNDRPAAQPQAVTTDEDTPVTVTLGGEDGENDPLSYRIITQPSHGTLSGDGNTYVYTAAANYSGDDSFSFVVNDGTEDSAPAVVSLTVRAANDLPAATADQYVTGEDDVLTVAAAQGVLANDSDVDGDALVAAVVRPPSYGTLTLNADGSLTYAPLANFTGDDSFTYRATDPSGGASATTTVSIAVTPVNDAPAIDAIADLTGAEGASVAFTVAATDPDADAITFSLVGAPAGATIDAATGAFTWTPTEAQGPATYAFAVRATDDGVPALSRERQLTITITEANAAPILGSVGDKSVVWANTLTFTATATDADEPANVLTFSLPNAPAGATINGSTGEFSWTPGVAQGAGTHELTVRVSDGASNADEQITVTVINPPPRATGMSETSAAAQANAPDFEIEVSGSGFAPTSAVQWNGASLVTSFISATRLTAVVPGSRIAAPGTHYVRVLNGAPGGGASDKLAFFVTEAPTSVMASSVATSESGTGTARAITTAESPSDATVEAIAAGMGTVAVARYATNPGGTPSFAAVGLWFDVNVEEGSTFSAVQITLCNIADGTLVRWWNATTGAWEAVEPAAQLSGGCLSLTVTGSSTPSLTDLRGTYFAIGKNTAPQALDDAVTVPEDGSQTIQVLSNDVDAEGDPLNTVIVDAPAHGTAVHNADGSFTYAPTANFNGTDAFTYRATDGSATSAIATVRVTVTAVNDAPTASADNYTADEDKDLVVAAPGVLANDADLDGQPLNAVLVSGPTNGTVTLNGDGSFTYRPGLHFSGNDAFSYRASDGSGSSEAVSVSIVVRPRMTVLVDMVPGSSTNSIGYSSSQTQIVFAVLSTPSFDATLVDPATTTLGNDQGTDTPLAKNADGTFKFMLVDVNGDGRRDFYGYVNKAPMKTNGDLTLATTSLTVLGRLKSPRTELFRGKDKVTVVP